MLKTVTSEGLPRTWSGQLLDIRVFHAFQPVISILAGRVKASIPASPEEGLACPKAWLFLPIMSVGLIKVITSFYQSCLSH